MKGTGGIIKCMERDFLNGLMEECTLGNTFKTKNMGLEGSNGLTAESMKDSGEKVFNMDKVKLREVMVLRDKDNGKMEKELSDN